MGNIDMHAVWVREKEAPDGVTPLEWKLLTTMEVKGFDDACEKVRWYMLRWGIEVYHRTLKSGCKIEDRQLGSAESIEKCLAIDSVVAWRICHLTKLGRETPHAPLHRIFSGSGMESAYCIYYAQPCSSRTASDAR